MLQTSVNCHNPDEHVVIEPAILYFGTPIALVSTLNPDGTPNLAPMSSAWALGTSVVLGLGRAGQTGLNIERTAELVINLPSDNLWAAVERLAPLTGRNPVPESKSAQFRYEPRKFEAAGLTPQPADLVGPPRVKECPLQLEATAAAVHRGQEGFLIVEAKVHRVHAARSLVRAGTSHVDTSVWRPLIYTFRHYFTTGERLGKTFRAEY